MKRTYPSSALGFAPGIPDRAENGEYLTLGRAMLTAEFDSFWAIFPRKVAKKDAARAWAKLSTEEQESALAKLPDHVRLWEAEGRDRQFIPHPATWLNGARWEDEIEMPKPKADSQWAKSEAGIMAEGKRRGVEAKRGESLWDYRARVEAA